MSECRWTKNATPNCGLVKPIILTLVQYCNFFLQNRTSREDESSSRQSNYLTCMSILQQGKEHAKSLHVFKSFLLNMISMQERNLVQMVCRVIALSMELSEYMRMGDRGHWRLILVTMLPVPHIPLTAVCYVSTRGTCITNTISSNGLPRPVNTYTGYLIMSMHYRTVYECIAQSYEQSTSQPIVTCHALLVKLLSQFLKT